MIDINLTTNSGNVLITNKLELFFQEVALAVKIGPTDIWGVTTSIDLTNYLFNQYVTTNQIQNEITRFITDNCSMASEFQYSIEVELLNVDDKELVYILFKVFDFENNSDIVQKFLLGA